MDSLMSVWSALDPRRRIIVALATLAVFVAVALIGRAASTPERALLYSGLDPAAAGEVIAALDQSGAAYEVQGTAIYVDAGLRDSLRMTLAGQGLPAASAQGYELLDGLTGFGTTSQMFDAAYWRAKEGELARTILSNPHIRAARVHISTPTNRPFAREDRATASVSVTTVDGSLNAAQARALRYLVASAVSGLSPDNVTVIDGEGGLIAGQDDAGSGAGEDRADELRARAQRLLEARVGYGNAVVEVAVETVTDSESIVERVINPESRVAISTEVEERTNAARDTNGADVTVASNLPAGDAEPQSGSSSSDETQNRAVTNYEVSETTRQLQRGPGAIRRLTVAVLVNDLASVDASGAPATEPRTEEELAALRDLVASAVGFDEARGDVLTIKSLPFEPLPELGSEAVAAGGALDTMSLIQLGVLAVVALILGLFVVRPILTSNRVAALPPPAVNGEVEDIGVGALPAIGGLADEPMQIASFDALGGFDDSVAEDPVTRLRRMIEERQTESIQILQNWIDEPEPMERT